jgi:hypothetical protein
MRRNYISPEYKYQTKNGTFNMIEQTSFFGSKMIDIFDRISVSNENLIYYQNSNFEQLNFTSEKNLSPIVYSTIQDKLNNHTIVKDAAQSSTQENYNTRWIIEINIKTILSNYLFATLKKYRTFEGVRNSITLYNNVNTAVSEYVSKNIINRYKYSNIEFFVEYENFSQDGSLRFKNDFIELTNSSLQTNKIQAILSDDESKLKIIFNQEKPSSDYNFNYYFNLYFDKI